jgi:hypothetical protein
MAQKHSIFYQQLEIIVAVRWKLNLEDLVFGPVFSESNLLPYLR